MLRDLCRNWSRTAANLWRWQHFIPGLHWCWLFKWPKIQALYPFTSKELLFYWDCKKQETVFPMKPLLSQRSQTLSLFSDWNPSFKSFGVKSRELFGKQDQNQKVGQNHPLGHFCTELFKVIQKVILTCCMLALENLQWKSLSCSCNLHHFSTCVHFNLAGNIGMYM